MARLILLLIPFVIASCKDNVELDVTMSDKGNVINVQIHNERYSPIVNITSYNMSNRKTDYSFSESLNQVYVYAMQDGKYIDCGKCNVKLDSEKKAYTCTYNEQGRINTTKEHQLYLSTRSMSLKDNRLNVKCYLNRTGNCASFVKTTIKQSGSKVTDVSVGVLEKAFIANKTSEPITFKHKGFSAKELWYYSSADISLDNPSYVTNGVTVQTDSCSQQISVKPISEGYFGAVYASYPANGKKIKDATLVAEINGKEVRTSNTLSSDLDIVSGNAYLYVLEWDGKELKFAEDENQEMLKPMINIPEGAPFTLSNITLVGADGDIPLNSDGTFSNNSPQVYAFNNDKLCYFSVAAKGNEIEVKPVLDSWETAASILLMSLPGFESEDDTDNLLVLKLLVAYADNFPAFADAVKASVVKNGYLVPEDFANEYKCVLSEIYNRFGLAKAARNSTRKTPAYPYFGTYSNIGHGFLANITNSTWNNTDKKWTLTFDVFSGGIGSYCFALHSKRIEGTNRYVATNGDTYGIFKYIIKPMTPSQFVKFGTLNDLTNIKKLLGNLKDTGWNALVGDDPLKSWDFSRVGDLLSESYFEMASWFGINDYSITQFTWDKKKNSGITFDFYAADEGLLIAGPGSDMRIKLFNFVFNILGPTINFIASESESESDDDNNKPFSLREGLTEIYAEYIIKHPEKYSKLFSALGNPDNNFFDVVKIISMDYLVSDFIEVIKEIFDDGTDEMIYDYVKDKIEKKFKDTAFDKALKEIGDINKKLKYILTVEDLAYAAAWMYFDFEGIAFQPTLNFDDGNMLPDIPGTDL